MLVWFSLGGGLSSLNADEIVINYKRPESIVVGDFECSGIGASGFDFLALDQTPCGQTSSVAEFTVEAGELWRYLKSQGIDSTDRLIFVLDLDYVDRPQDVSLESLDLTINGQNAAHTIMSLDRGQDNRLVVRGVDLLHLKPEARVEVGLGFDFMERFTAQSSERIVFRSQLASNLGSISSISVQGNRKYFTLPNALLFAGFVVFWGMVFWILKRVTLPGPAKRPAPRP